MNEQMFISIDGNNVGKVLEKYILCNQLETLTTFSLTLRDKIETVRRLILCQAGEVYLAGGDNIMACVDTAVIPIIVAEVYAVESEDIKFSIGIGETAISAYLALKYAKAIGSREPICCMEGLFKSYPG